MRGFRRQSNNARNLMENSMAKARTIEKWDSIFAKEAGDNPALAAAHSIMRNLIGYRGATAADIADLANALEAYAKLRTAESLNVKVTRRGAPVSIDFKIQ